MRKDTLPTLKDVAKLAKVGTTTVSRAINGGHRVNSETLTRVQNAIGELGFQPNRSAQILKSKQSQTIGILIPSITNPFFATLVDAVQQIVKLHGYVAILAISDSDKETEESQIEALARHRIDGLLICGAFPKNPKLLASLEALRTPVVLFDRPIGSAIFPCVLVDNLNGARNAVMHLIKHKHRRIACLQDQSDLYPVEQRVQGYRAAMREFDYPALISESLLSLEVVQQTLAEMLNSDEPPTALFCTNNVITTYAFQTLRNLGYAMPQHLALIGFDDFDSAILSSPSMTVVRQPIVEIGRHAAHMLFERIEKPAAHQNLNKVLTTHLCIRESCGCTFGTQRTNQNHAV